MRDTPHLASKEAQTIHLTFSMVICKQLHAKADTHIEVRDADGTVYINRSLKAGDSYRVPNLPGMSLSSTNSGALDMELDGQMMGRAGADQETTIVNLDPQAIVDRSNSR